MNKKIIRGILGFGCVGFYDGYQSCDRSKQERIKKGVVMFFGYIIYFPYFFSWKLLDIKDYFKKKK